LNRETLPLLRELTEKYPAFETAWLLYLKNLKNLGDTSFDRELINGAIRINDRRKLYLLLNGKEKKTETDLSVLKSNSDDSDIYDLFFAPGYRLDAPEKADETIGELARSIQNNLEKKDSLIEKFLEAKPKMPPIKESELSSPLEGQKVPDQADDDFVTETLAQIYARQGYHKKAIHIFEKLSLKYPEKSTYFAGQIEKIKTLMNN
jgi:tetratricopeptide (TPR) repeat protein